MRVVDGRLVGPADPDVYAHHGVAYGEVIPALGGKEPQKSSEEKAPVATKGSRATKGS